MAVYSDLTLAPPTRLATLRELKTPFHCLSLLIKAPQLLAAPKGNGKPVVLLPGYLTDEFSLLPLQKYLSFLGYKVFDWGIGRNMGQVEMLVQQEAVFLTELRRSMELPNLTLIGWSLGGVVARELTRQFPDMIAEVITMGTPITGGPKYTAPGKRYAKQQNIDLDEFEQYVLSKNQEGFSQPVTSIYSKNDGVVAWQASLDVYNQQARNIEVNSTHLAMGFNAEIWQLLAEILATQEADQSVSSSSEAR